MGRWTMGDYEERNVLLYRRKYDCSFETVLSAMNKSTMEVKTQIIY